MNDILKLKEINKRNIIFDLDGTIIDSASGIIKSIEKAFKKYNVNPKTQINHTLIGPPIRETINNILEEKDKKSLDLILCYFIQYYDAYGYKNSNLYPSILETLITLEKKHDIYIATNKRFKPTIKILKLLKIEKYFNKIFTLDMLKSKGVSKSDLLIELIKEMNIDRNDCVYVGDRTEDEKAASINKIEFIRAKWGYIN